MNPALMYGGLSLAGGGLNALFGKDDEFQMNPEAKRIYDILLGKYKTGDFGMSPMERENLLKSFKTKLGEESQTQTGRSLESLGRRNLLSPGQAAGVTTDIQSTYGKAFGKGVTDIDIANEEMKRQEEAQTLRLLSMLPGQSVYKQGGGIEGMGDFAENMTLFNLLGKNKKPTLMDLFYGG